MEIEREAPLVPFVSTEEGTTTERIERQLAELRTRLTGIERELRSRDRGGSRR